VLASQEKRTAPKKQQWHDALAQPVDSRKNWHDHAQGKQHGTKDLKYRPVSHTQS
jgi:hypothetical protein